MRVKELRNVREDQKYTDAIEARIRKLIRDEIYLPLLADLDLSPQTLKNSQDDLAEAIRFGRITFQHGKLLGKFNAKTSKAIRELGGTWDRSIKGYRITLERLPETLRQVIATSDARFTYKMGLLDNKLKKILPEEIADKLKVADLIDKSIFNVDKKLRKSLSAITITPELTLSQREKIAAEYTNNLKLKIVGWTKDAVKDLRKTVEKNTFQGFRYEGLIEAIQKNYGVGLKKARFLARQETNLLVSKFKEARYTSSGIHEYKWRCVIGSPLHPVRKMHQELNDRSVKGEVFRFDDPPKDDPNGGTHNPGEAFNCRCIAIAIVRFSELKKSK